MSDNQGELLKLHKEQRVNSKKRIAQDSKQRLKGISTKKFKTCFVSAISEFETTFGLELWGHGLPEEELTSIQRTNRDRWCQVRTNILNKGNTQLRAMDAELDLHEVKFLGYQMISRRKDHENQGTE